MTDTIPKTKQLYFFLMPEETTKVLEFIVEQGCIIYAPRSTNSEPCEYKSFVDLSQIFFCPRELSSEINTYKIADGIYALDPTTSPVIEFECPLLRDKELSRGRIYFRGGYMGRDEWITFSDSLYGFFKKVSSFMKKFFLTNECMYDAYISKGSQLYVSAGGKLVQF